MLRLFALISIVGAVLIGAMQFSASAEAKGWSTYDASEFMMAQAKGKTIVVDVYADWCPTCRAQAPILEQLRAEKQSDDVHFVKVNFDTERAFLHAHKVRRQSTILVFQGEKEVARSIAQTNRSKLRQVVLGAL